MQWTSILAIYALFWALSLFLVLPFGVRTHEEAGAERVPGQAESAPHDFRIGKVALRTTIVSAILFGLYYLNYVYGWIAAEDLNLFRPPE
jgi:predicted secreted protein